MKFVLALERLNAWTKEWKNERTKERKNERTKERKNERTKERKNERTKERKNERTKERKNERTKERKNERTKWHTCKQALTIPMILDKCSDKIDNAPPPPTPIHWIINWPAQSGITMPSKFSTPPTVRHYSANFLGFSGLPVPNLPNIGFYIVFLSKIYVIIGLPNANI